jgi:hypothetical protein
MAGFARALPQQLLAAAGLWMCSIGGAQAAGALAIGACGVYGFAYDYPQETAAAQAALAKCAGGCRVVPVRRACGAIAIDARNACGAHGYAVLQNWGGPRISRFATVTSMAARTA